ncbi:carboxymuconolactone decarboxylase family protein [Cecembia calidifontis]|uniref:4-carboxymuconolactone decarboxylase n=1 Tax=Cecembia calidifontis TaxID=1187080 RepID=A0A4V2F6L9_9BACT|nr:carboxymuconolactone decarboxylase family protein [Cecembia calidifontis]RZS96779.1 4-carboxymuconolactone decarboxylase [Cecembia calidifontis]
MNIQIRFFLTFLLIPILTNIQAQIPEINSRKERAELKFKELFAGEMSESPSDPELLQNLRNFIYGEVFYFGNLDDKTRELITITALTTMQMLPQLESHAHAALNIGVSPIEIRESVYQLASFIGYPKVLNAVNAINNVFESRSITLPLSPQGTVKESERLEKGSEIQFPLYGDGMKQNMKDLPEEFSEFIPDMLTKTLFGDYYTRQGLDLQTRELLILAALTTMGGTERQLASHAIGNLKAGNSKETMLSAMVQLYPYIGFPRISNAIKVIMETPNP